MKSSASQRQLHFGWPVTRIYCKCHFFLTIEISSFCSDDTNEWPRGIAVTLCFASVMVPILIEKTTTVSEQHSQLSSWLEMHEISCPCSSLQGSIIRFPS